MPEDILKLPPNPFESVGLYTKYVSFGWLNGLFKKGYKRPLSNEDFYQVPKDDSSKHVTDKLERCWDKEQQSAKRSNRKPKLYKAVVRYLGTGYLFIAMGFLLEELMRIVMPYFIGRFISYFVPGTQTTRLQAYLYASVIILFQFGTAFIHHPNFFYFTRYGMQLKVCLGTLVFKKAMQLSQSACAAVSTGHIVNLVTSDVQILERVTIFLTQVFISPILLILTAAFSYYEIGAWSFPGIIVLLLLAPVQGWMGRNFAILRHKTATMTDLRFKIMNEVISGMRVIKMYNWEAPFSNLVADVRKKEVKVIKKTADLKGLNGILYNICIPFIGLIVFVPYVMVGNSLTPEKVFTVLGLFYAVRVSLTIFFPECVRGIKEGMVSCARIQKFLELDDKKPLDGKEPGTENVQPIVEVKNITAQWNMALNAPTIKDLSFTVNPGELFMVVGPVGAGKSSLLLSLLGELPVIQGTIQVKGQMSYASQQSWIFSGTIRENILFGQEYDEARYKKVVKACALEKDFTLFPNEDDTMVGERGVALSGGQKARINLARASYFPSDIILLDDPLSAVDTHVGKQLFEECVRGLLRSRITILVTHQLQYLKGATMILCLQDGRCVGQGTLEDLSERGLDVVSLMSMTSLEHEPTTAEEHTEHEDDVIIMNGKTPLIDKKALMDKRTLSVQSDRTEICLRQSQCDIAMGLSRESLMPNDEEEVEKIAMKPDAEKQTTGTVTWKVYWDYFRAGSSVFGLFVISMLVIIAQSIILVSEWWLAEWADREDYNTKRSQNSTTPPATLTAYSRKTYITVYGIFVAAGLVFSGLSSVSLFRMFVAASQTLHNNMFRCVLRTPIYFFDTNPVGRVLNRFAKDISQMDDLLPSAFFDFIRLSLLTFAILLLNVASIPYLLVGAVPMVLGFGYLRNYYLRTSRDIKRLEAINRSPVYSHISASLHGLITIRAYEAQKRFITTFYDYLDFHSASYFLFLTTQRWLGYRLDMICASFMLFSVVGSLVTLETGTAISASVVGLCLIYAKMLTGMFQWCTRQSAEVENLMTSVERVVEYSHLEPESEPSKPVTIPRDWPEHGVITAEKVYYTHHKTLPFVLKDLNFEIKAEEKIGIVGRTGAGKSSLLGMLFRLNVPEGLVRIDSLPITDMKLHDLRSAIAIIPQDPVLFSGTLRKNLDPFGNYTDEDLWNSLEEVQLKEAIDDLPDGIETHLAEGGSNFSVGQRQLICLARAILSHNKILVIDEATANVDHSTDTLIQETIRNKFKDCTVLTIAHRLNTIMDSDRVMVLDEGRLVEFDEPYLLLKRKHGVFTQLVEQSGVNTAAMLKETARQAYELRHDDALQDFTSQDITFPDASLQDVTVENAMSQNIKEDVTSPGVAPEDASSQGVLEDITEQDDVTHKDVTQDVTPKDVTQDVASKDVTQQTDNNTPDIVIETAPDHGSTDSRVDDDDDDDKSDADHSDDHNQDVNNRDNMVDDDDDDDDNDAHSCLIKSGDRGDDDNNTR